MTLPQLALNEDLARILIRSVQNALTEIFRVTPSPGKASIQKDYLAKGDVSGILGMVQDGIEATLVVSFPKSTLSALLACLYGPDYPESDSSLMQGVGELTNIIYASAKKQLNEQGYGFKMSMPSVIIGADHMVLNIHEGNTMILPFRTEHGEFHVEISRQATTN